MNTPNNINPNGVSDGDSRVVPMDSTLNPNGGRDANVNITDAGTVLADQHQVIEPTGVEYRDTTPSVTGSVPVATGAQRVVVEDSVTHQAGEGITAGMPPSQETPDIFDNSPQAAIKTQTADNELVDNHNVKVIPDAQVVHTPVHTNAVLEQGLEVLPDGSVDIQRDRD